MKNAIGEMEKSLRIFTSALTWFFLRTVPSSRKAKPACMARTMIPPSRMNKASAPCLSASIGSSWVVNALSWCGFPLFSGTAPQRSKNCAGNVRGVCREQIDRWRRVDFPARMEAFLVSAGIVALAEMGDKTQLLALVLAARFRKPWPIVFGILVATLFNHALAGAAGAWITSLVGPEVLRWILAGSFIAMAV